MIKFYYKTKYNYKLAGLWIAMDIPEQTVHPIPV